MSEVVLTGQLVCANQTEAQLVADQLRRHVVLTRAEPGCLAFTVQATHDPLIWQVEERFTDPAAFRSHQVRAANSDWGLATAGIERRYTIDGI